MLKLISTTLIIVLLFFSITTKAEHIILTPNNSVTYSGPITKDSSTNVMIELLQKASKTDDTIYLVLNSPGGSIEAGLNFIEGIKSLKNVKTITIFGASMAFGIAQLLPGERLILSDTQMMAHRASGGVSGQFEDGELESRLNHWKTIVKDTEKKIAKRMKIPLKMYKAKIRNEWWEYGTNTIKKKMADRLVTISCNKELINKYRTITIRTIFGNIKLKKYSCPLLTDWRF